MTILLLACLCLPPSDLPFAAAQADLLSSWGAPADPDLGPALVEALRSPRYADREAATAALLLLGDPAREALASGTFDRDQEVRDRAGALLGAILVKAAPCPHCKASPGLCPNYWCRECDFGGERIGPVVTCRRCGGNGYDPAPR